MEYMRYSRAVIVLEEKDREFADKPGEEMKGYLRVETGNNRGAFRCVMQNVKYYPRSEYTYQLILLGTREEKTIHTVIGTIPVTRYGTGEVYLRFRPNDVDDQGNDYGCYTTAIVAAVSTKNTSEQLHPVLIGKTGNLPQEVSAAAVSGPASRVQGRSYTQYYAQYLKHVCEYLWNEEGSDREIRPFEHSESRWMKIEDPDTMFLVSPGAKYFAKKYGHFLLGRRTGEEGFGGEASVDYYVAVPGEHCSEDQPDGGDSGFQLWRDGYWILRIDGTTGEIYSCETL